MPLEVLLGKPPKMLRDVQTLARTFKPLVLDGVDLQKAVIDVVTLTPQLPANASSSPSATARLAA